MTTLSTLELKIESIKAQYQAAAEQEIERYKLSLEVNDSKKALKAKIAADIAALDAQHKEDIKAFEKKYAVPFDVVASRTITPASLSTDDKCKMVAAMVNELDQKKYMLNADDEVINLKKEPIKSVIVFKVDGKKQTLAVSAFRAYMMNKKK